jgi:hypothetical protein
MTTTAPTLRQLTLSEADTKRTAALKAHKQGDFTLRNSFLHQAADRYRTAGQHGLALWCERFAG